jgi:hypothetical protein
MEESHMMFDISQYDLHYVKLKDLHIEDDSDVVATDQPFTFALKVNGSNENRPKISVGDWVLLRPVEEDCVANDLSMFELAAVVQHYSLATETATCILGAPLTSTVLEIRFHVRFTFERCAFSFMHETVDLLLRDHALRSRLFPSDKGSLSKVPASLDTPAAPLKYSNGLNDKQRTAVRHILSLSSNLQKLALYPYIVFGPPGTGKTSLITAAILEMCETFPSLRILAVAPSDAAADVILSRLSKVLSPERLFRLNWWQRSVASVPIETLKYCCEATQEGTFDLPTLTTVMGFQVVVTTCGTAGLLRHLDISQNYVGTVWGPTVDFDVVVLDEASQASECESWVPLSLCKKQGLMVLAGDTQQLGPTYRSPAFRQKELYPSLQARLLRSSLYRFLETKADEDLEIDMLLQSISLGSAAQRHASLDRADALLGTYLTQNYRSNQHIFRVPSRLFYANALTECADPELITSLNEWSYLPKDRSFPVLCYGVDGKQQHIMDSPSFYNEEEVDAVTMLCASITSEAKGSLRHADIGIIAAFRAQVLLIRSRLRANRLGNISVGSVEDFQGMYCV